MCRGLTSATSRLFAFRRLVPPTERSTKEDSCSICFDILSDGSEIDNAVKKVVLDIETTGYSLDSGFKISVALPASSLVRVAAIRCRLHETSDGTSHWDRVNPFYVKETLKNILINRLQNALGVAYSASSSLLLDFSFRHRETENDVLALIPDADNNSKGRRRKKKRRRRRREEGKYERRPLPNMKDVVDRMNRLRPSNVPEKVSKLPLTRVRSSAWRSAEIRVSRAAIFLYGRYMKYLRGLSQTPWFIDKSRKGVSSLEEELTKVVLPYFGSACESKFNSGGREDIDVRMLGSGRPFILEITNASRIKCSTEKCRELEEEIFKSSDGAVSARDLKLLTSLEAAEVCKRMEAAAVSKRKRYSAVIWTENPVKHADLERISRLRDIVVKQTTPIRVAHRRTMLIREKRVHRLKCEWINSRWFKIDIVASAGTYIKEFVHGDFGRTQPNLSTLLGCRADILQLDVAEIIT